MISLQKLTFEKKRYISIVPILLFFYFLYNFRPESLFNLVKQYVFGSYQNIQLENPGIFIYVSLAFYFLTFFIQKSLEKLVGFHYL